MEPKSSWTPLLIVVVAFVAAAVFMGTTVLMPELRKLSYLTRLESDGVVSEGIVLEKGVVDTLVVPTDGCLKSILWLGVEFIGRDNTPLKRVFGVARRSYHEYEVGDTIKVAYLDDTPVRYEIWESLERNEHRKSGARTSVVIASIGVGVFVCLSVLWGVLLYLTFPGRRRRKEITFSLKATKCPECGCPLEECYVMSGMYWYPKGRRKRWSAAHLRLPGYKWYEYYVPRGLPGYHCPECKTIFFKYG